MFEDLFMHPKHITRHRDIERAHVRLNASGFSGTLRNMAPLEGH